MEESTLRRIAQNVKDELQQAALQKNSSFPSIPNPISTLKKTPGDKILVLVIGGSVFKKAFCVLKNGKIAILTLEEKPQPPLQNKAEFLSFVASEIDPAITHVVINFAYPVTPLLRDKKLDGVLLSGMKENRFAGLVGEMVGKAIEEYVLKKRNHNIQVSLANDTICLLLSGIDKAEKQKLCAMVIGTGLNLAFFSDNSTAINLEAANFDKFTPSREVLLLDKESASPGKALFEKEIAGGYLFEQYNRKMKQASSRFRRIYSTKELDIIASSQSQEGSIAREILHKSASLAACLLAGLSLYKNSDLTCVMEGSLFWKGHGYQQVFEKTLKVLLPDRTVTLVKIPNSPLLGAARLIL